MKKIPTLFLRDDRTHQVVNERTQGTDWVLDPMTIATRKWDGTACLWWNDKLFKRRTVPIDEKWPEGFSHVGLGSENGKIPGWIPITPDDKWHHEALNGMHYHLARRGTFELVGPKINGNPEGYEKHVLIRHGDVVYDGIHFEFLALRDWLMGVEIEGLVFYHPDGRMAKIKKKDFGLDRNIPKQAPEGMTS